LTALSALNSDLKTLDRVPVILYFHAEAWTDFDVTDKILPRTSLANWGERNERR